MVSRRATVCVDSSALLRDRTGVGGYGRPPNAFPLLAVARYGVMNPRFWSVLGVGCAGVSLALYGVLHVVPPSAELDWSRRTISQYALLSNGWLFDTATLLLAAGSLAVVAALWRAGLLRRGPGVVLLLWVVGLVGVVWFEKHDWAVGPSVGGTVHRAASLLAFLSLPLGALLAAGPWLRHSGAARWVALGGVVSLLCFAPLVWAVASEPWTGVPWWHAIPLGGVERVLGLAEVVTVVLLAGWAARAGKPAARRADSAVRTGPAAGG